MALRTTCIYDGKLIGIESIYTLSNGKQINIPGRVEHLRKLGKENKLFCPCGCGNNLILIAGDRNIREQHFRIKYSEYHFMCSAVEEGAISLHSKVMLKLWLEKRLHGGKLECRIPVNTICKTERKYEYSFYDFKYRIGLCYWYDRLNVESDKISNLERHPEIINTLYIVDGHNSGSNGQYPEFMIKVQNSQGFVIFLDLNEKSQYEDTELRICVYLKNEHSEWKEIEVLSDTLDSFGISKTGELAYGDQLVIEKVNQAVKEYKCLLQKQIAAKKKIKEQQGAEEQRILLDQKRVLEEQKSLMEKRRRELEDEIRRLEAIDFSTITENVFDLKGRRLFQCKYCGKKGRAEVFYQRNLKGNRNLGVCKECEPIQNEAIRRKLFG